MSGGRAVRLVATDLDGTLLNSEGRVSARTLDSIRAAQDAGMLVVPATGRPRMVALDVMDQLDAVPWWVFANGSVTWHAGRNETVRSFFMQPDTARDLVLRLRSMLPGVGFAIEFPESVVFEAGFEAVVPHVPTIPPSVDVVECIDQHVQKILVFDLAQSLDDLYYRVADAAGDDAVASYSGLPFVELADRLVTKATALELLAADLGLEAHQVAAFGDNHNDLAMLEWAGRSFAMAGATDDAKEVAGAVIGHNDDDAVAEVIDRLVLELADEEAADAAC